MRRAPVAFDRQTGRRIVQQTRKAERRPKTKVRAMAPPRGLIPLKYGVVTSQIGAAAGSSFGAGTISLQAVSTDANGNASYADLATSTPCYSGASAPIAVGRLVIVAVVDGYYHVIVDFC